MMKKIILILFIIVGLSTTQSQDGLSDPHHEIFCGTENYGEVVIFNLYPVSAVWDVEWPTIGTVVLTVDDDFSADGGSYSAQPNIEISYWRGYNHISIPNPPVPAEDFGFGVYKLEAMGHWIYLDWRDVNYGYYSDFNGHCQDIWIKYDGNTNGLYLINDATETWSTIPIHDGSYFTIWQLKNQSSRSLAGVLDYWQKSLAFIDQNNNPHLFWEPSSGTPNVLSYVVNRGVEIHLNTITGNFNEVRKMVLLR